MNADEIHVFGGSGSPRLTAAICDRLDLAPARGEVIRFSGRRLRQEGAALRVAARRAARDR
jgi:phosphoribosylpyrophosphate synthetase